MTPEEAYQTGKANQMIENDLSSVKITHTTKGTTWEIKVKHINPRMCAVVAQELDDEMRRKYGSN